MKQEVPALSPILRSNTQGDLLASLFLDETAEWTQAELHRRTGANVSVIHREIERLRLGGVIVERSVGRSLLISPSPDYELRAPLAEIVLKTFGPRAVLSELLSHSRGVIEAYIYGSWAARYSGERGRPPQDVDVLAVGDISRADLERIEREASGRIGKEVNVTRINETDWEESKSAFLTTLRERPLVPIHFDRTEE